MRITCQAAYVQSSGAGVQKKEFSHCRMMSSGHDFYVDDGFPKAGLLKEKGRSSSCQRRIKTADATMPRHYWPSGPNAGIAAVAMP
jgi:hypothetical protein